MGSLKCNLLCSYLAFGHWYVVLLQIYLRLTWTQNPQVVGADRPAHCEPDLISLSTSTEIPTLLFPQKTWISL